jgi:hypothetical protein
MDKTKSINNIQDLGLSAASLQSIGYKHTISTFKYIQI